jgi:hypothetical protein
MYRVHLHDLDDLHDALSVLWDHGLRATLTFSDADKVVATAHGEPDGDVRYVSVEGSGWTPRFPIVAVVRPKGRAAVTECMWRPDVGNNPSTGGGDPANPRRKRHPRPLAVGAQRLARRRRTGLGRRHRPRPGVLLGILLRRHQQARRHPGKPGLPDTRSPRTRDRDSGLARRRRGRRVGARPPLSDPLRGLRRRPARVVLATSGTESLRSETP